MKNVTFWLLLSLLSPIFIFSQDNIKFKTVRKIFFNKGVFTPKNGSYEVFSYSLATKDRVLFYEKWDSLSQVYSTYQSDDKLSTDKAGKTYVSKTNRYKILSDWSKQFADSYTYKYMALGNLTVVEQTTYRALSKFAPVYIDSTLTDDNNNIIKSRQQYRVSPSDPYNVINTYDAYYNSITQCLDSTQRFSANIDKTKNTYLKFYDNNDCNKIIEERVIKNNIPQTQRKSTYDKSGLIKYTSLTSAAHYYGEVGACDSLVEVFDSNYELIEKEEFAHSGEILKTKFKNKICALEKYYSTKLSPTKGKKEFFEYDAHDNMILQTTYDVIDNQLDAASKYVLFKANYNYNEKNQLLSFTAEDFVSVMSYGTTHEYFYDDANKNLKKIKSIHYENNQISAIEISDFEYFEKEQEKLSAANATYILSPNPAHEQVFITKRNGLNLTFDNVKVFDTHGRLVQDIAVPDNFPIAFSLDVSSLRAGIYFVKLYQNGRANDNNFKLSVF
jgi:Secretion system C-terminal sorting domain